MDRIEKTIRDMMDHHPELFIVSNNGETIALTELGKTITEEELKQLFSD